MKQADRVGKLDQSLQKQIYKFEGENPQKLYRSRSTRESRMQPTLSMQVTQLQGVFLTLVMNWQGVLQRLWNLQTSFGQNSQGFDLDLD